jgi:transport and Golgi organization protein 2
MVPMCTAVIGFDPSARFPLLLAGIRDEFLDRSWQPPGRYWPDRPALIGGRDRRAGGTWLAVDPAARRVATVLNAHGRPAPEQGRVSRGELPLLAAAGGGPGTLEVARFDPFHLVCGDPAGVRMWSWDGAELRERELAPGLHVIVNTGLEGADQDAPADIAAQLAGRIGRLRPRLLAARRPEPGPGPVARAWGEWLPLLEDGDLDPADPRALLLRRDFGGRAWGTTSVSLVALSAEDVRYDFRAVPGAAHAWTEILGA